MAAKKVTHDNPLRGGPRMAKPADPVSIIIFGATGDLTARKLIPALFNLEQESLSASRVDIVGFARRPWNNSEFREEMKAALDNFARVRPDSSPVWDSFADTLSFVQGNFDSPEDYIALDKILRDVSSKHQRADNRLYYLAAPPQSYGDIVSNLGAAGIAKGSEDGWRRVVIEKPFGSDHDSARDLNRTVHKSFEEDQVFRIDHYLGKETVQNILVLRFANSIFEPVWNRDFVDHVQITVAESVGVGNRVGFYDQAGVVRDIFQNHLLQLLTLIGMEPATAVKADAIRDEKVKLLRSVVPIDNFAAKAVRARYTKGIVDGQLVPGYLEEKDVPSKSSTATYAALKLFIDNRRWQNVPFYLRSGKRLPTRATEISVHFKKPPHHLFQTDDDDLMRSNILALRIQPDEGISLKIEAKLPGPRVVRYPVTMDFRYGTSFGLVDPPDAYERLLLDAILGESTLFARSDEIECAWNIVDPLIRHWVSSKARTIDSYEAGSYGPQSANTLIERDGRKWRRL